MDGCGFLWDETNSGVRAETLRVPIRKDRSWWPVRIMALCNSGPLLQISKYCPHSTRTCQQSPVLDMQCRAISTRQGLQGSAHFVGFPPISMKTWHWDEHRACLNLVSASHWPGFEFLEAYVELFSKYTTGVGDVMKIISRKKYSLRSISSNNVIWTGGSTCLNSAVLTQTACLCYPSCFIYLSTAQSCVWFTAWPFQTIKQNINH